MNVAVKMENVALSTRVRLARNVEGYPFPNCLRDEKKGQDIIRAVCGALEQAEEMKLYYMNGISQEEADYLQERNLISRALRRNTLTGAAFVSADESISVLINEEDHLREQYFMEGFDLKRTYERISGIDDIISARVHFAFDKKLGYLTACPTNLGTGLRASVMLFLPALTRNKRMKEISSMLKRLGLTVRGAFGEGSGTDGELYQISNEVTLGKSEVEILQVVEDAVGNVVKLEFFERQKIRDDNDPALIDKIFRSLGILCNCYLIDDEEFNLRMTDIKFGIALGYLSGSMKKIDDLIVHMRPANLSFVKGVHLEKEERDAYRAEYAGKALRDMNLLPESGRDQSKKS